LQKSPGADSGGSVETYRLLSGECNRSDDLGNREAGGVFNASGAPADGVCFGCGQGNTGFEREGDILGADNRSIKETGVAESRAAGAFECERSGVDSGGLNVLIKGHFDLAGRSGGNGYACGGRSFGSPDKGAG